MIESHAPMMEFHISRKSRDRYQFDESLFSLNGNVILANFRAARLLAQKINQARDPEASPNQVVKAGQLNAMGLIDEIMHFAIAQFRERANPLVLQEALAWLDDGLGAEAVGRALVRFVDEFPPLAVYRDGMDSADYVAGETEGVPHRQLVLEEMLVLWLANMNPATDPFAELFDDDGLADKTSYPEMIHRLHQFFDTQPAFGPDAQNLMDMLRSPAIAEPLSLSGQLRYIRERWGALIGSLLERLLGSIDLLKEEEKAVFFGPGPIEVTTFRGPGAGFGLEGESARYSPDREWMPRVVMIAKSTYVWLDQLSKKYQRSITRLDQIPDEELDNLARWGFSGLWLIGLWERSQASQKIKQIMGNPEAVASAYSLYDYQIAWELGGDEAYRNLAGRAWSRGIRLASDMVPNHMGIDSKWVMEHPEWFLGLDYSPFPSYTFNGPDLSNDGRVGIFLEDHYYSRSDAAVVFKRVDRWTGGTRYIYHGNDGTTMPWNDTAQLDYLNPAVREAVIQTILHVARMFPIIRFDAAMTLAKRHVQRLWFPEPGTGGAIASRSDHALSKYDFDAAMPIEFWREVVERVAREVPDTLLLAEAFWMMEGYFVRTLGMHRVYNSAFMHMLKNEDNAKYRQSIKNVLEYDPQILKRYVNFMNNPDEETAVAQFGKDGKYFGVCTLMVTLPGLPMIGHGQVQGFSEKYGMEYRRAYWDEQEDMDLIGRHEREVFPLMHRRYVFAEVRNFLLYDFYTTDGVVNEDVYAYSNSSGESLSGPGERGLVVFHNKFADARGWIRMSAPYVVDAKGGDASADGAERITLQKSLGEGLGLHCDANTFCIFRDYTAGLDYIRNSKELCDNGLYIELGAFKYQAFLDFREVVDDENHTYAQLAARLGGRGVPSIADALREMAEPVVLPVEEPVKASKRASGILLHPTSLPGRFGIGDLGDAAYRFIDFLANSGQKLWQIMPLGPTSYGDSPYQALSAFAGNPLLISPERLLAERYVAPWDLDGAPALPPDRVDYGPVIKFKQRLLRISFAHFKATASTSQKAELAGFVRDNASWLDDYALFAALKDQHGGASWRDWERDIATRQPEAVERWRKELDGQIQFHQYVQFLFQKQWAELKAYANEHGVDIIGDIPIFVAYDSADAWAHSSLFRFDADGAPTHVAGVPPDAFSPTGQLWGNPLYDWDAMAKEGFAWWIARFRRTLETVDIVRLDHFRGFDACWEVPASDETAINGRWVKTPGRELFEALEKALGPVRIIAEDLGVITPEVEELRLASGFPGMKVLQFAFDGDPDHQYLPHNYEQGCVVYTGTHDNDTTAGWFGTLDEQGRAAVCRYLDGHCDEIHWELIRLAMMSVADTAIFPLQDVLGAGSEGRMNTPGRASGNWTWRYTEGMLTEMISKRLLGLTRTYGRAPRDEPSASAGEE